VSDGDVDLRAVFETLDPKARDTLRRILIHDQADRDAISSRLMRHRDRNGQGWADIIHLSVSPVKPVFARTIADGHHRRVSCGSRNVEEGGASGRKPRHCSSRDYGFASTPDLAVGVPWADGVLRQPGGRPLTSQPAPTGGVLPAV
jgi:hypothetical protein